MALKLNRINDAEAKVESLSKTYQKLNQVLNDLAQRSIVSHTNEIQSKIKELEDIYKLNTESENQQQIKTNADNSLLEIHLKTQQILDSLKQIELEIETTANSKLKANKFAEASKLITEFLNEYRTRIPQNLLSILDQVAFYSKLKERLNEVEVPFLKIEASLQVYQQAIKFAIQLSGVVFDFWQEFPLYLKDPVKMLGQDLLRVRGNPDYKEEDQEIKDQLSVIKINDGNTLYDAYVNATDNLIGTIFNAVEQDEINTLQESGFDDNSVYEHIFDVREIENYKSANIKLKLEPATWEDYLYCRDTLEAEGVNLFFNTGYLIIEMGEGINHSTICNFFIALILTWLKVKNRTGESMGGCTLQRSQELSVSPDLVLYVGDEIPEWEEGEPRLIDLNKCRPPDLVGEISDTTILKDKKDKKIVYAEMGVKEYWIINIREKTVTAFFLDEKDKTYKVIGYSKILRGLRISLTKEALLKIATKTMRSPQALGWIEKQFKKS